jgi:NADH dehydrogenase FAD-containing subunit
VGSRLPLAKTEIMTERIVILGGGTAGTLAANRLRREFPHDMNITVVDRDDRHVYQPGLLFVPFGRARPQGIVRSRPHFEGKTLVRNIRSFLDHRPLSASFDNPQQ